MKRFLITLCLLLIIPASCLAAESEEYNEYLDSFDLSAFDSLDDDTAEFLRQLGIDNFDYESISALSPEKIFSHIGEIILNKSEGPLKSGLIVICFIILSSFFRLMNTELNKSDLSSLYSTVSCLAISIFLVMSVTDCIALSCSTVKLCANFSFAFFLPFA